MNREELERLAREVAENARHRARVVFQVKHPHYTAPPGAGVGNDEVLAIAHDRARRLYDTVGQFYNRGSVWSSLGIGHRPADDARDSGGVMEGDRIDRLIAALECFARGPVPRRYLVRFPGYGDPDAACVVEAFSHEDAVKSAQIALYRRGHEPNLVRPAKDDDCLACGARLGKLGDQCDKCGRTREQQTNFLYDPWSERL